MTSTEQMKAECAKRDREKVPLATIARLLGYRTWTEWAEEMTKPNPLLMDIPFIESPEAK